MPTETPFFFYGTCLQCGRHVLTYPNGLCPECCGKMNAEGIGKLRDWQKRSSWATDVIAFLSEVKSSDLNGASREQLLEIAEEYAKFEDLSWKYDELNLLSKDAVQIDHKLLSKWWRERSIIH